MRIRKIKSFSPFLLAIFGLLSVSSCNRGMGCPTNFSLDWSLVETIVAAIKVMF